MTTMKMKNPGTHTRAGFQQDKEMETAVICTRCYRLRNAEGEWIGTGDKDVLDSGVKTGYGLCSDCATDIYRQLYTKPGT